MRFILSLVRLFLVHGLDLEQGEETLFVLGGADLAGDQIPGLKVEAPDLGRRNIDIFRAWQIIEALRAEKTEPFRQHFQHTFRKKHAGTLGVFLQDVEYYLVLPHGSKVLDPEIAGHLVEVAHRHCLQFGDVQRSGGDVVLFRL